MEELEEVKNVELDTPVAPESKGLTEKEIRELELQHKRQLKYFKANAEFMELQTRAINAELALYEAQAKYKELQEKLAKEQRSAEFANSLKV